MKLLLTDCGTLGYQNDLPLEVFRQFGEVTYCDDISREELLAIVSDYDLLLCNKTEIDREILEKAAKLRYIGLFATGYNNIDRNAAREHGVTVCNAGSYSTNAVAQQVFAYLLSHFSSVDRYDRFVKNGGWMRSPSFSVFCYPTDELAGKSIGLIGYGSIGKRVARIANAFDMKVLVFTRTPQSDPSVTFVSLDTLLRESDIVSVHCPLNEQSRRLFNRETFAKCKRGCFFINTARGGIVDETALREALLDGTLSGAAVDVLQTEPMDKNCVLADAPNLLITPHTAWAPLSTRLHLLDVVCESIRAFLDGRPIHEVTNLP